MDEGFKKFFVDTVNKNGREKVVWSYSSSDGHIYYNSIKPNDSKYILTRQQYRRIHKMINIILMDHLALGEEIILPYSFGSLRIQKFIPKIKFEDGKIKTKLIPNWGKTIRLWYEDEEAREKKMIVREKYEEQFRVLHNRQNANIKNLRNYELRIIRRVRRMLKHNIDENLIEKDNLYN